MTDIIIIAAIAIILFFVIRCEIKKLRRGGCGCSCSGCGGNCGTKRDETDSQV